MGADTGLEYSLVPTVAEMKGYLGFSEPNEDDPVKELLLEITEDLEHWCGRHFVSRTWDLRIHGNGNTRILLPEWPVQSVTSIYLDDDDTVELPTTSLLFDNDEQRGRFLYARDGYAFTRGEHNVHLTFVTAYLQNPTAEQLTAGYLKLPASIVGLAKRIAARRWKRRQRLGDEVVSETFEGGTVQYLQEELTERDKATLRRFTRFRV